MVIEAPEIKKPPIKSMVKTAQLKFTVPNVYPNPDENATKKDRRTFTNSM